MPRRKTPDLALRWGDGSILRRTDRDGRMRFQARWYEQEGGARPVRRSRTFDSLEAAEAHLRTIGTEKRAGIFTPESRLTMKEAIDEYAARKARNGDWSPNTVGTNRVLVERLVLPHIGDELVTRVTRRQLQTWVDTLRQQGKSASATASVLSIVKGMFSELIRMDVVTSNPATDISVGKRDPGRDQTWTIEEVRRVLEAAKGDPMHHALYLLALTTGMRPGELRALQWHDVDLELGLVRCRRTITRDQHHRQYMGTTTKTRRDRLIAVAEATIDALREWRLVQIKRRLSCRDWHDDDIIFDRGDGRFMPESSWQAMHREVVTAAGLNHLNPHAMRHTYATLEMEAGTNPNIVKERVGHASVAMTLDRYSHVSMNLQKATVSTITRRILDESA